MGVVICAGRVGRYLEREYIRELGRRIIRV